MDKTFLTTTIASLLCFTFVAGCGLNVDRITTKKTGEISSIGFTTAKIDLSDFSGNISVSGSHDSLIKATVSVSEMKTTNSTESASDYLSVSLDTSDKISSLKLSYSGNQDLWELLRIEDISLVCNRFIEVDVASVNGNISIDDVNGFLTITNTNGNITATVVKGCHAKETNGSIEITLKPDSNFTEAYVETTNGAIKVYVPKTFKADLDLKTTNGKIKAPNDNTTKLHGGNAAAIITCKTTNGQISIIEQ